MLDSVKPRWSVFEVLKQWDYSVTLVCYLDDSSNDGTVVSLGGYIARNDDWVRFEGLAKDVYARHGVDVLHTKDLHATKDEFADWTIGQKREFVTDLFDAAKGAGVVGVSACAPKSIGKKFAREHKTTARFSTLGLCFARVVMSLRTEGSIYHIGHPPGDVSLIIEQGNRNNDGLLTHYREVKAKGSSFDFAKSLTFVGKRDSYAIQLADFWAFYSRRMGAKILNGHSSLEVLEAEPIDKGCEPLHAIAAHRVPHHLKLVNDVYFDPATGGVMTWADSYSMDPDDSEWAIDRSAELGRALQDLFLGKV